MYLPTTPPPPPSASGSNTFYVNGHSFQQTAVGTYQCGKCGKVDLFYTISTGQTSACALPSPGFNLIAPYSGSTSTTPAAATTPDPWGFLGMSTEDTVTDEIQVGPPCCSSCEIELCAELDAYYGKDLFYANFCSKCRRKIGV